jgi:hypothetical protein
MYHLPSCTEGNECSFHDRLTLQSHTFCRTTIPRLTSDGVHGQGSVSFCELPFGLLMAS